ncbi:MAG: hypothetical protein JJ863_03075 [Deltaproteobacteria bacterium]|nr:hypothetical protein [Deltaproteobacteria bacterium]
MRTASMVALVLLCGCGDDGRGGTRPAVDGSIAPGTDARVPPGTDGGPRADAQLPPGTDGGPTGRDGGTAPDPIDFCQLGCATGADCGSASAAFDADNYECDAGICRYTGCNSDSECQSTFMSTGYVCRDLSGLATCQQACSTASDCGSGSAAFDTDNYECDAGVCRYTGCNSDSECTSTYMDSRYGCREAEVPDTGVPIPTATRNCVLTCSAVADCSTASAAFDADNYECDAGVCRYRGCNSDSECTSTFMDARYLCR